MTNTNPDRYITSIKEGISVPFIGNNHIKATVTDTTSGKKTEGYGNSASEAQTHAFDKIAKNQ